MTIACSTGQAEIPFHAYTALGVILGWNFQRYADGYRFAKLACDLVEKHGFSAYRPLVYAGLGATAVWTEPIAAAIEFGRAGFPAAIETGDPIWTCFSTFHIVAHAFVRNDPLDVVWRETGDRAGRCPKSQVRGRRGRYHKPAAIHRHYARRDRKLLHLQRRAVRRGAFEAQLTAGRMPLTICWYWILKLKARFLSGNYAEALVAAARRSRCFGPQSAKLRMLDYFYYAALAVSALYETASSR